MYQNENITPLRKTTTKHTYFEARINEVPGDNTGCQFHTSDYTDYKRISKIVVPQSTKYGTTLQGKSFSSHAK